MIVSVKTNTLPLKIVLILMDATPHHTFLLSIFDLIVIFNIYLESVLNM